MPSLNDVIKKMKELDKLGYDCYFEGQGDGTVKPVATGLFIVNDNIDKNKKNKK